MASVTSGHAALSRSSPVLAMNNRRIESVPMRGDQAASVRTARFVVALDYERRRWLVVDTRGARP